MLFFVFSYGWASHKGIWVAAQIFQWVTGLSGCPRPLQLINRFRQQLNITKHTYSNKEYISSKKVFWFVKSWRQVVIGRPIPNVVSSVSFPCITNTPLRISSIKARVHCWCRYWCWQLCLFMTSEDFMA